MDAVDLFRAIRHCAAASASAHQPQQLATTTTNTLLLHRNDCHHLAKEILHLQFRYARGPLRRLLRGCPLPLVGN
jgi:hypothetical protein